MMRTRSFDRCESGTTAVEFGLVALPLLLIVFGICEYGRLLWTREALHQTAISGARCIGILQPACSSGGNYDATATLEQIQALSARWSVALSEANITVQKSTSCGGIDGFASVTLTYNFRSIVPKLLDSLSSGQQITASACFPNALS